MLLPGTFVVHPMLIALAIYLWSDVSPLASIAFVVALCWLVWCLHRLALGVSNRIRSRVSPKT
jgi:hypothetical protein